MEDEKTYWQQFDEAFFKDGHQLASTYLAAGFTKVNLFAGIKQLYKSIDQLIDTFLERITSEGNPSDCRKGCAFCCHQTVLAVPYELLYLADFIQHKFKGNAFDKIVETAKTQTKISSTLKLNTLLKHKQPCPLLHPGLGYCRAYQARPMACRIYLSASAKSCETDLENPDDDTIFPQLFEMPLRAGRMLNEGFHARVREGKMEKLQAFENSIEEGLTKALMPNAYENWAAGKKIFRKME